jgi:ubiquitin-conjugating enzyme E2 Z
VVTFLNGDGHTRFNPNLYVSGKVCLSILNTWSGEKWSACQSIRSVLLSISILILNEEPFLNEPGIARTHCSFKPYHQLLEYKNIEVCLLKYLTLEQVPTVFQPYHPMFVSYFLNHYEKIVEVLKKENTYVEITIFQEQSCFLNYIQLEKEISERYRVLRTQ